MSLIGACDLPQRDATIALDSMELTVAGRVHEVRVAGAGATDSIVPMELAAAPGDAVRFIVADRRPHALAFVADSLDPAIRAFLDRTGQLRGPPLVSEGASWVVLLDAAPPGRYPFVCRSHDAPGTLIVAAEE